MTGQLSRVWRAITAADLRSMNRNDRAIVRFTMVGHGLVHTYELAIPILMTVWLSEFAVTPATLGTVAAVGYGLFGLGALPGGVLVDRFGSQTLIVTCLFGMGGSFLALAFLPGVAGIALALAGWGLAASVYHPAGLALISDGVQRRGSAFAYHGMAGNVGIAAGPFLTAVVLVVLDWRVAVAGLAVPALLAAVAGLSVDIDEHAAVDAAETTRSSGVGSLQEFVDTTRSLFTSAFLIVLAVVLFNGLYYRGTLTFLPEMLSGFLDPLASVGGGPLGALDDSPAAGEFDIARYLYAGLLAIGVGGQYVGGRLTDAIEPERGLALLLGALVAIALLFVPAASTLPTLLLVSILLGFVLFAMQPLSQATIAKHSRPEYRGLSFGYTYLAVFGVGALGASLTGAVLTYGSTSFVFLLFAAFDTVALGLALVLVLREK